MKLLAYYGRESGFKWLGSWEGVGSGRNGPESQEKINFTLELISILGRVFMNPKVIEVVEIITKRSKNNPDFGQIGPRSMHTDTRLRCIDCRSVTTGRWFHFDLRPREDAPAKQARLMNQRKGSNNDA